jgi:hypothetical protein
MKTDNTKSISSKKRKVPSVESLRKKHRVNVEDSSVDRDVISLLSDDNKNISSVIRRNIEDDEDIQAIIK